MVAERAQLSSSMAATEKEEENMETAAGTGLKKGEDVAIRMPTAAATALANQNEAQAHLEAAGRRRAVTKQTSCLHITVATKTTLYLLSFLNYFKNKNI